MYSPQQQQQHQYPQQQQHYGGGGAYDGQQHPGYPPQSAFSCCQPDPQQQQQPGQHPPSTCPMCCPDDPNTHFCDTAPYMPGANSNAPPSALGCFWNICDATTWFVGLWFVLATIGFGLSFAFADATDLLGTFDASNSYELDLAMAPYLNSNFGATPAPPSPQANNTTTTTAATSVPRVTFACAMCAAAPRAACMRPDRLSGSYGSLCMEDSFTSVAMLMNISRWLNFRSTLYFLAMTATLALLVIIIIVSKQQQFVAAGCPPGGVAAAGYNPMPQPYVFHGTPLYYTFRTAWGAVSIIVFFWMVTELYQYWWFINDLKGHMTTGKLNSFWWKFDRNFVPSTICVGIFLCWPIVHMCLELAFFILGVIPWYLLRQSCYPQLANAVVDPDKPFDSHSCCIRTDWFYMNFHQCHRLGFSEGMWQLWTGSREPFCRALECQPTPLVPYGAYPVPMNQAPAANRMGGEDKKSRKTRSSSSRRRESESESRSESASEPEERRKSSRRSKDRSTRKSRDAAPAAADSPTPSVANSAVFAGAGGNGVTRGFGAPSSNAFLPPPPPLPGGASPTKKPADSDVRGSRSGWGSDTDVRASKSKDRSAKKNRGDDDGDGDVRRSRSKEKRDKSSSRRSQSSSSFAAGADESERDESRKKEKREKRDKSDKKSKKERREDD